MNATAHAQPDLFSQTYPPHTEVQKKEIILKRHDVNPINTKWLADAREKAVAACRANTYGAFYHIDYAITTDDVRLLMGVYTRSAYNKDNNLMGCVLRGDKRFEAVPGALHKSTAEGSHGNPIQIWRLKQEYVNA